MATPDVPDAIDAVDVPDAPDVVEPMDVVDAAVTPDVPDVPVAPDVPDVRDMSDVPGAVDASTMDAGVDPLALWLRFEESDGPVIDSSSSGLRGAVVGTAVTRGVPGVSGSAMRFSGGHVSFPTSTRIDLGASGTIEAWIHPDAPAASYSYLLFRDSDGPAFAWSAGFNGSTLGFGGTSSGGGASVGSPNSYLPTGEWTHVAVTYNASTIRMYRNGVLTHERRGGAMAPINAPLLVGARTLGYNGFRGAIDELRFWRVAKTAPEVCASAGGRWVPDRCESGGLVDGGVADVPDAPPADRPATDAGAPDVPAAATISFAEVDALTRAQDYVWLGAGDVNGDRRGDLMQLGSEPAAINLVRGAAGRTFGDPLRIPLTEVPSHGVTADFVGDGLTDVAVTSQASNVLYVVQGDRSRGLRIALRRPLDADDIAAGDFDADGRTDIVVGSAVAGDLNLYLLRGLGDGRFDDPVVTRLTHSPQGLAAGNVDGRPGDELVALLNNSTAGKQVTTLRLDPDRTFRTLGSFAFPTNLSVVYVVDVDRDGFADVVPATGSSPPRWFAGRADGTLTDHASNIMSTAVGCLADFDNDGRLDAMGHNGNNFRVFRGTPDGTFAAPTTIFANTREVPYACIDLDGDGRADAASAERGINSVLVRFNTSR